MSGERSIRAAHADAVAATVVLVIAVTYCIVRTLGRIDVANGISWFGTQRATVLPYTLGLAVAAALLARAARHVPRGWTRLVVVWTATLTVGLVVTPYSLNAAFNLAHMAIGSLLFAGQLVYSVAIARTRKMYALLGIEFVGGVVCFTSVIGLNTTMLYAQIVFQAAFLGLLFHALRDLDLPVSRSRVSPASAQYRR